MDWSPFILTPPHPKMPLRSWRTLEGLGDRMRIAAFAELQAIHAFSFAADAFGDMHPALADAWRRQISDERRHFGMITGRMETLGIPVDEQPVSDRLFRELTQCEDGRTFCIEIVKEEHRGMLAARKLVEIISPTDRETADVFAAIAADEVSHVALAKRFFDWTP